MGVDLVEWLRAQLDEDERIALAATPGPWHEPGPDSVGEWTIYGDEWAIASTHHYPREEMQNYWPKLRKPVTVVEHANANAEHIALHDPARVLREVEAKRLLLRQFELRGNSVRATVVPSTGGVWDDLLRLLALPYSDRPGYREEWRP